MQLTIPKEYIKHIKHIFRIREDDVQSTLLNPHRHWSYDNCHYWIDRRILNRPCLFRPEEKTIRVRSQVDYLEFIDLPPKKSTCTAFPLPFESRIRPMVIKYNWKNLYPGIIDWNDLHPYQTYHVRIQDLLRTDPPGCDAFPFAMHCPRFLLHGTDDTIAVMATQRQSSLLTPDNWKLANLAKANKLSRVSQHGAFYPAFIHIETDCRSKWESVGIQ